MKTTNLVSLLKSFSKDEFKEFGKFVRSPFFNTHKDVVRYYSIIKKGYPALDQSKEFIFSAVYPGRKFNNGEYLKLNSRLYNLGLEYLKCIPDKFTDEYKLLGEFRDRDLKKQFQASYKKLNDYIDNESGLDNLVFVRKIYIISSFIRFHMNRDEQKKVCDSVIKRGNYFAYQSLLWIMIQLRDMTANFNAFNYQYNDSAGYYYIKSLDLEKIITGLEFENNRLGRYLKYYLYCLLIMLHPENEGYYDEFKNAFRMIYNEVNRLEKNNYLARLQTYVMNHIQRGNMKFVNELLSAYKFFFDKKNVFENDIIPMPPFRNCLALALYKKDINLIKELAGKYSERIFPDYREDTMNLANAYLNFISKKYELVEGCLNKFSFKYKIHKIDVKHLLLRMYFESNDIEPLLLLIDSFKHFLNKNNSISENSKIKYFNLLLLVNNIYSLKNEGNKVGLISILNDIKEKKYELYELDRLWLIEKLNEKIDNK